MTQRTMQWLIGSVLVLAILFRLGGALYGQLGQIGSVIAYDGPKSDATLVVEAISWTECTQTAKISGYVRIFPGSGWEVSAPDCHGRNVQVRYAQTCLPPDWLTADGPDNVEGGDWSYDGIQVDAGQTVTIQAQVIVNNGVDEEVLAVSFKFTAPRP